MTEKTYIDVTEAAQRLGGKVSEDWVRRQCHAKVIPATKLGRSWSIDVDDLYAFMRKYRGGETPAARTRIKGATRRVA